ncbi:MAG: sensor histidine kinase [Streptosporangiaceae bacterium]
MGAGLLALTAGRLAPRNPVQGFLVALIVCGSIVLLRRWPLPVLAVVTAMAGMVAASGFAPVPLDVTLGLALYFAALRLPRRRSISVAVATAAVLGGALVYSALAVRTTLVAAEAVEVFVPLAGAWFIADSVAARRRYLAGLAAQAERERAAEAERARQEVREERVRIARELHDVLAHTLAVITVQAGVGRRLAGKRPEEANAALESIETIGRTAQDELRVALGLLRDGEAGGAPLAPAPRLTDLKYLVDTVQASGTPVRLRIPETDRQLSPALELSIYRVVQEALTNVVKHAPGARATVDVAVRAGKIRLDVRDDGGPGRRPVKGVGEAGREAPWGCPGTGHGIVGMRERIGAFGGWLAAEPAAGGGFRVIAEVPIEGAA